MTLEPITSISAEEAVAKESSLAPLADRLASVKFEPVSASGDSHVFTTEVAAHCEKRLGVKFHMGTKERRIRTSTSYYVFKSQSHTSIVIHGYLRSQDFDWTETESRAW